MPRVKSTLYRYPKELALCTYARLPGEDPMPCYFRPAEAHICIALVRAAERFIKARKQDYRQLVKEYGWGAHLTLFFDCFEFAHHPEVLTDPKRKAGRRIAAFIAKHTDFALAYLSELHKAAKHPSDLSRAMSALRFKSTLKSSYGTTIPLSSAVDKEIAASLKVSAETIKKARLALKTIDAQMWERKGKDGS